jgi:hypothetical protein
MSAPYAPVPVAPVVVPATTWRLAVNQSALARLNDAWTTLAVEVNGVAHRLNQAADAVYEWSAPDGNHWSGEAATRYNAHRTRVTERLDSIARRAREARDIVAQIAGRLAATQRDLAVSLRAAGRLAKVQSSGNQLVFRPVNAQARRIVFDHVRTAGEIKRALATALRADVAALQTLAAAITKLAANRSEVAYGGSFRLATGEARGTSVLVVGDRVIVNTGPTDDEVVVDVDPHTKELLVGVNGQEYRFAKGMEPVIRTGGGNDTVRVPRGVRVNVAVLTGDGDDLVRAGDGDDTIFTGRGNDVIYTGDGRNYSSAGPGRNYTQGGRDADTLVGGGDQDVIYGLGGADRIAGRGGPDYLDGGDGPDRLYGGGGRNILFGGRGADRIIGGPDEDRGFGGEGSDWADLGSGRDIGYFQQDDRVTEAEQVVRIEYRPPRGLNFIEINGSDGFREHVWSDFEALASGPARVLLRQMAEVHKIYPDHMLRIDEVLGPYANHLVPEDLRQTRFVIQYNPTDSDPVGGLEEVPLNGLYHEGIHFVQYGLGQYPNGTTIQSNGTEVLNSERAAVGLPHRRLGKGGPRMEMFDGLPPELTENFLRRLLGLPERTIY